MRTYTFEELTERYGLSKAGFSKFFHTNEDKLIKDEQKHYRQEGKKIFFDEEAVEIMDQLRGLNKDIISAKEETANEIRIRELLEENNTLKTQLLLLTQESRVDKERIIKLTEETVQVRLLTERNNTIQAKLDILQQDNTELTTKTIKAESELAVKNSEIEQQNKMLLNRQTEIQQQQQQIEQQEQQLKLLKEQQAQYDAVRQELYELKNRSFWQRFKDLF